MTRILPYFGGLSCTHSLLHSSGVLDLNQINPPEVKSEVGYLIKSRVANVSK